MKTDDLINLLATGVEPVEPLSAERRYAKAISLGLAAATLLMLATLHLRSDLADAMLQSMFWIKLGFVGSLACAGGFASLRLAKPGAPTRPITALFITPVFLMWALATLVLAGTAPEERTALILGQTWNSCPLLIALLSIPVFVASIWAMKGLAPTQPRFAGFAAGLLAGATAALVYCFHCPESAAPFIGIWYTLGIFIPAVIGAAIGPRLLCW